MAGTYSVTHVRNKTVVTTFVSLCLEILTWFLVYEGIMMSYRSSLHVVLVQWFLAELWPLDWNLAKYLVVTIWDIDLIFGMRVYNHKLQINWNLFQLNDFWPTYSRWALKFGHILICHHFYFTMIWDIDLIFGMWVYSDELPIKFEFRSDWMILG